MQLKRHDLCDPDQSPCSQSLLSDGVQCGDEGGAYPGDPLSRENEKVQTRGDLFQTFQSITLSPR